MNDMPPEDLPLEPAQTAATAQKTHSLGGRIRNWFITGVIIAGPLATTAYIVWWFVDTIDTWAKHLVPERFWPDHYLPFPLPGFGVIFAFIGLTLLGFLAANLAGRTLIRFSEASLDRMPVIRTIYKNLKQIFETVFAQTGTAFRKVGMIEYPGAGRWSLVFICPPPSPVIAEQLVNGESEYVSVFLPCTPNPTTGFYFYLPAREVVELDMSPDDAVKLIVSCGVIEPELHAEAKPARKRERILV